MKRKLALAVAGALLFSAAVYGHHAESAFDAAKFVTLEGTVTKFELINPHGMIQFTVTDEAGKTETWIIELGPPVMYVRAGWNRNTIKAGDRISVTANPHKSGLRRLRSPSGEKAAKISVNGKELKADSGGRGYGN